MLAKPSVFSNWLLTQYLKMDMNMISQHIHPEKFTSTDLTGVFLVSMCQKVFVHIAPTWKHLKGKEKEGKIFGSCPAGMQFFVTYSMRSTEHIYCLFLFILARNMQDLLLASQAQNCWHGKIQWYGTVPRKWLKPAIHQGWTSKKSCSRITQSRIWNI